MVRLSGLGSRKPGYKIALIADNHIRDTETISLTHRALTWAIEQEPDIIAFAGDTVAYWKDGVEEMLTLALEPMLDFEGPAVAVPGNHDYFGGTPEWLRPIFDQYGIQLLRNESKLIDGVNWIAVDSANEGMADPYSAILQADFAYPAVVLWHEPDMVEQLPAGPDLMLAGHSHGGQFITPWGFAPGTSRNGRKYIRGWYPDAPVPIYVSRGLGTTGPPTRLFCPPEVTLLTVESP